MRFRPDTNYRLQPIFIDDLAELAVSEGGGSINRTINAIGPETFTYRKLVEAVGEAIGRRRVVFEVSPGIGYAMSRLIGWWVRDKFITREEIKGLMDGLLFVDTPSPVETRLTDWLAANRDTLGLRYASELARRRDRSAAYGHSCQGGSRVQPRFSKSCV